MGLFSSSSDTIKNKGKDGEEEDEEDEDDKKRNDKKKKDWKNSDGWVSFVKTLAIYF